MGRMGLIKKKHRSQRSYFSSYLSNIKRGQQREEQRGKCNCFSVKGKREKEKKKKTQRQGHNWKKPKEEKK